MGKVYVYCRVANENQVDMELQQKVVQDYCEDKGLKIDAYFCDNGVSGLKYDREGLSKLFNVIQSGDIVVIKNVARLSRNIKQYMYFEEQIKKVGATLVIVDKPVLECGEDCLEMIYNNYIQMRRKNGR